VSACCRWWLEKQERVNVKSSGNVGDEMPINDVEFDERPLFLSTNIKSNIRQSCWVLNCCYDRKLVK